MAGTTIRRLACGLIAAMTCAGAAHATSLIGTYAPNGGVLSMKTTTEFLGSIVSPGDTLTTTPFLAGIEPFGIGAPNFLLAPGTQTIAPAGSSGVPKSANEATITATAGYAIGSAATNDVLTFSAAGLLNAETAQNVAGENADAHVSHSASFAFYIDDATTNPSAPPLDSVVGTILLPDLRTLDTTFENLLALTVFVDGGSIPIAALIAGAGGIAPGIDVDVLAGHAYTIRLDYDARVIYGTDPPFSIGTIDITLRPLELQIPAPGSVLLFGIGLLCIARAAARHGRPRRGAASPAATFRLSPGVAPM